MIYVLDPDGYPLSEIREAVAEQIGAVFANWTSVPRTGNRFVGGEWVTETDNRDSWHDPVSMDSMVIYDRGQSPPDGWVRGEPPGRKLPPISTLREAAWSRIKFSRDAQEFGPFVWEGHTFDGDAVSLSRLGQALEAARFAISTDDTAFTQPWKLADNTWITLTATQVFGVYRARAQNTLDSHMHAEQLRQQIEAATTAEQLQAIQWPSPA